METLPVRSDNYIEGVLSLAIEKNVPVETIEKLIAAGKEMQAYYARRAFYTAKAAFQAEMPLITNTKEVRDRDGKLLYKYSPMPHVVKVAQPLLTKHGFSWAVRSTVIQGAVIATCILTHSEGHTEEYSYTSPFIEGTKLSDQAKVYEGTRTVAKRCAFADALGITCQDEEVHSEEIRLVSARDVELLSGLLLDREGRKGERITEEIFARFKITHLDQLSETAARKLIGTLQKELLVHEPS
jgi:ERF superfamily